MDKNKIFTVILIFFVAVTGLAGLEIMARFFEERDRFVVTKEFDPLLGWRLKPGHHEVRPSGKLKSVSLDINNYGLRGDDFPAKAGTEKRLMVLGDSFVFSRHFALDETFTGRLENALNRGGNKQVRVINAGVPGYGSGQELLFMKKLADDYGIVPDSYILVIFPNDILDNLSLSYGNYEPISVKPRFELNESGKAILKHLPENNLEGLQESFRRVEKDNPWKLRSLQFIKLNILDFMAAHPRILKGFLSLGIKLEVPRKPGLLNGWYDDAVVKEGVPLMKGLIREMKEEAQKRGVAFKAVIIPSPVQIYPAVYRRILSQQFPDAPEVKEWIADPMKPQRMLGALCEELNLECLDLYSVLEAHKDKTLYLSRDGHFDRAAHELVAAALAEWLEGKNQMKPEERFNESKLMPSLNTSAHQGAVK